MYKKLLDEALTRLELLHPKIIDLSLNRTNNLLKKLDNPHSNLPPTIHIAGTNGKGSTLSFIKNCIENDKKLVHSYISPHLVNFNERINIKGKPINDKLLIKYLKECEKKNNGERITFFEITTCLAFLAFNKHYADYLLLEVGLGGKLDATNVIQKPELSVITPISLDHEEFLGNSLEKITKEKAGIIKFGVNTIVGKQQQKVIKILKEISKRKKSSLSIFGEDWVVSKDKKKIKFETKEMIEYFPFPSLVGDHQVENLGTAIATLKELKISQNAIKSGIKTTFWPGRFQLLKKGPLVKYLKNYNETSELWLDGGHNEAAAKAIVKTINDLSKKPTFIILGMTKNKNIREYLKSFVNLKITLTGIRIPEKENSFNEEEIFNETKYLEINSFKSLNIEDAIEKISNISQKKTIRIVICGSLYLAGYILRKNR